MGLWMLISKIKGEAANNGLYHDNPFFFLPKGW